YFAKPWGAVTDNAQLGVPIRTEPVFTTDDFKEINRSSVKEVYDHIISDLKKADDFKITNSSSAKATNDAINALRARIALIQERWQDAVTFSEKVIPNFTLSSDVTDYFRNELGPESIFEIKNTPTDNPGGGNHTISVVYNINERPGALITNAYKSVLKSIITDAQQAALEASSEQAIDTRVTELLVTDAESPLTIDEYTHSDKYEDGTNLADNIPIFRLSEMILTKAEALVHIDGINEESIDLLNQIRARAIQVKKQNGEEGNKSLIMFDMSDFQTKEDLIDAIFRERSVELSYEGHRRTDLQRRRMNVRGTPWDANELVFPIPQSQTDVSDIQQNPGY